MTKTTHTKIVPSYPLEERLVDIPDVGLVQSSQLEDINETVIRDITLETLRQVLQFSWEIPSLRDMIRIIAYTHRHRDKPSYYELNQTLKGYDGSPCIFASLTNTELNLSTKLLGGGYAATIVENGVELAEVAIPPNGWVVTFDEKDGFPKEVSQKRVNIDYRKSGFRWFGGTNMPFYWTIDDPKCYYLASQYAEPWKRVRRHSRHGDILTSEDCQDILNLRGVPRNMEAVVGRRTIVCGYGSLDPLILPDHHIISAELPSTFSSDYLGFILMKRKTKTLWSPCSIKRK